ncbi:GDSL esterase/lipase 2-like isoform X2 [Eucalyptus grandis]|uniref:GDSL esterase/lipase 2-like isoform X2 n=1 Tax=Eucalyptus grandis TaxID=71139 RepID=UPI00192EA9AF|nr:GDSL esterase/lipase 2-like isoform X2 [Eucalyptus grandis]
MSAPDLHILFFAVFVFVSLLLSARCDVALFIFGDSLNNAGINNYVNTVSFRANFPSYGEIFFRCPTGSFTDGRLIADFIAEYAKLPLIPPYLQLKNDGCGRGKFCIWRSRRFIRYLPRICGGPQDSAEAVREGEENGFGGRLHGQHRRQRLLEPGSQQSSFVSVHFHGGLSGDGGWQH